MSKTGVERRGGKPIALVLLDEHPLTRVGVRSVLAAERDISVVAEAETIDQAIDACRTHSPDVVLVDVDLGPAEMVEAIRRLREVCHDPAIVVLTHQDSDSELFQAAVAGAAGHHADVVGPAELTDTIRRAAGGEEPIRDALAERPNVGRRVLETFRELVSQEGAARDPQMPDDRQLEILHHAARGLTNQQIARQLGVSTGTVRAELSALLRRLGMRHRTQAVVHAVKEGWIELPGTAADGDEGGDEERAGGRF